MIARRDAAGCDGSKRPRLLNDLDECKIATAFFENGSIPQELGSAAAFGKQETGTHAWMLARFSLLIPVSPGVQRASGISRMSDVSCQ
jgi:hypothetical protein